MARIRRQCLGYADRVALEILALSGFDRSVGPVHGCHGAGIVNRLPVVVR